MEQKNWMHQQRGSGLGCANCGVLALGAPLKTCIFLCQSLSVKAMAAAAVGGHFLLVTVVQVCWRVAAFHIPSCLWYWIHTWWEVGMLCWAHSLLVSPMSSKAPEFGSTHGVAVSSYPYRHFTMRHPAERWPQHAAWAGCSAGFGPFFFLDGGPSEQKILPLFLSYHVHIPCCILFPIQGSSFGILSSEWSKRAPRSANLPQVPQSWCPRSAMAAMAPGPSIMP